MKNFILLLVATIFVWGQANAVTITTSSEVEELPVISVGNSYDISPVSVAKDNMQNIRSLNYMLENYTDRQLRTFAKSINHTEIVNAKKLHEKDSEVVIPEELSEETLGSREKLGEYLREHYSISAE